MKKLLIFSVLLTVLFSSLTALAGPAEVPLIAGKKYDVGTVYVWNDEANLYIQLELDDVVATNGWCLTEAKIHVGQDLLEFPVNKGGNPKLGHFEYAIDLDSVAISDPIMIELGDLANAESLLIAAHASLELEEFNELDSGLLECSTFTQGAWGEGTHFNEKGNWAMYFEYTMESPEPISCCDLVLYIQPLNPTVQFITTYTITLCGESVADAYSSGSESLSDVIYDEDNDSISLKATLPDGSIQEFNFILENSGLIKSNGPPIFGFWQWENCQE